MNNRLEQFCFLTSFVLPLGIYFYTAAPGVYWEDSAAYSTVAATLGIPYSPGFPLWVLLGKLFTWLNSANPARATNMMSGFFGAVAVALFYLCVKKILVALSASFQSAQGNLSADPSLLNREILPEPKLEDNQRQSQTGVYLTALGAALAFAFSQTVWLQAVRAEVYSLQLVLTLAALLLALSLEDADYPTRFFLLGAFFWGLSLPVHPLLSASVLPGFFVMGFFRSASRKKEMGKWAWALGLVLLAFVVYLYLPLRSIHNPYLNWNQPDNWDRFWAAVTRSQSWRDSIDATPSNLSYANMMRLASFLGSEYTLFFWFFTIAGILVVAHHLPRSGLGIFVLLLCNFGVTLWATEFNPWNLDLLGYLSFGSGLAILCASAALFAAGVWLSARIPRLAPAARWSVPVVAGLLALHFAGKNWARANLHNSRWTDKMAQGVLAVLPPNAVVLLSSDPFLTSLWYWQGAMKLRPDVTLLFNDVFMNPIHRNHLLSLHPDLVFKENRYYPFTLKGLQEAFKDFYEVNHRPIFTQVDNHISEWRHFWPAGWVLQYRPDTVTAAAARNVAGRVMKFVDETYTGKPEFHSRENLGIQIFNWGLYVSKLQEPQMEDLLWRAARFDEENPRMWTDFGKACLFSRRFELAEKCFKLALSYDPYNGKNFLLLAYVLKQLGKKKEAKEALAEGDWLVPDKLTPMTKTVDKGIKR